MIFYLEYERTHVFLSNFFCDSEPLICNTINENTVSFNYNHHLYYNIDRMLNNARESISGRFYSIANLQSWNKMNCLLYFLIKLYWFIVKDIMYTLERNLFIISIRWKKKLKRNKFGELTLHFHLWYFEAPSDNALQVHLPLKVNRISDKRSALQ